MSETEIEKKMREKRWGEVEEVCFIKHNISVNKMLYMISFHSSGLWVFLVKQLSLFFMSGNEVSILIDSV